MSQLQLELNDLSRKIKTISGQVEELSIDEMTEKISNLSEEIQAQSDLCNRILNQRPFIDEFVAGETEFLFIEDEQVPEGFFQEEGMSNLKELVWNTKKVGNYMFSGTTIKSMNLPYCESIGDQAYAACQSLVSVNLPKCKEIGRTPFLLCNSLETLTLPSCEKIDGVESPIVMCRNLKEVFLSACKEINGMVIQTAPALTLLSLPQCRTIQGQAFGHLDSLKELTLPVCEYIGTGAFEYCESLASIYLPGSTLCRIQDSKAFASVFDHQSGQFEYYKTPDIYVPYSMIDSYKNGEGWNTYSYWNFKAIEEVQK